MRSLFSFPDPVNEIAARLVAGGVVLLTGAILLSGQEWLLLVLAYGFLARVASGPRFSPLGLLVTRLIEPRLPIAPRPTPGPPKRFAQAIGATLSTAAVVAWLGFGSTVAAFALVAMILVAASLESLVGFCLGCQIFRLLMRIGLIPESVCEACNDITKRPRAAA